MTDVQEVISPEYYVANDPEPLPKLPFFQMLKEEIVMLKWRALVLMCLVTFGQYYINDFPGAIGMGKDNTIEERCDVGYDRKYNNAMNLALYSAYCYPNVVLAVCGGLLIDKYLGIRKATFLFISLILISSGLFTVGVAVCNYPLLVISRFIFGLGGESLTVGQSAYVARYFSSGRGMALAFGITISVSRVGSSFTFMFSPRLASAYGVDYACLAGVATCALSFISVVALILIDVYAEKKGLVKQQIKEGEEVFKFKHLKQFPIEIWIICGICLFDYCAIFPFSGYAKNFFVAKYNESNEVAATKFSMYLYTSVIAGPILGAAADATGRYPLWCLASSVGFITVHMLAATLNFIEPLILSVMLGVSLSMLASGLWPSVPYTVPSSVVGICYGFITSIQNAGLGTWPLIAGAILDHYEIKNTTNATNVTMMTTTKADEDAPKQVSVEGYNIAEYFLAGTAMISFVLCVVLMIIDAANKGVLMSSPSTRAEKMKARDADKAERQALAPSETSVNETDGAIYS